MPPGAGLVTAPPPGPAQAESEAGAGDQPAAIRRSTSDSWRVSTDGAAGREAPFCVTCSKAPLPLAIARIAVAS